MDTTTPATPATTPGTPGATAVADVADDTLGRLAEAVLASSPAPPPSLVAEIDRILGSIPASRSLISASDVFDWLLDLRGTAVAQGLS